LRSLLSGTRTDKRSGITLDPNRRADPAYIVRLLGRVVTVSVAQVFPASEGRLAHPRAGTRHLDVGFNPRLRNPRRRPLPATYASQLASSPLRLDAA